MIILFAVMPAWAIGMIRAEVGARSSHPAEAAATSTLASINRLHSSHALLNETNEMFGTF